MDYRKVQKQDTNSNWHDIDFKDLKENDIFRMFEPTGEPVVGNHGTTEFVAYSDAYIKDDLWQINAE